MDSNEERVRRDFQLGPARPPDPHTEPDAIETRAQEMLRVSKAFHLDLTPAKARKRAKAELEAEAKQAALEATIEPEEDTDDGNE